MHGNKIGLLIPFAQINKRGGLNNVRGSGEKNLKINKRRSSCIKLPRKTTLIRKLNNNKV